MILSNHVVLLITCCCWMLVFATIAQLSPEGPLPPAVHYDSVVVNNNQTHPPESRPPSESSTLSISHLPKSLPLSSSLTPPSPPCPFHSLTPFYGPSTVEYWTDRPFSFLGPITSISAYLFYGQLFGLNFQYGTTKAGNISHGYYANLDGGTPP